VDHESKLDAQVEAMARSGRSVLLVEDNDDHAELVRRALKLSGQPHKLVRLEDGEQALSFLLGTEGPPADQSDCALILLDLRLPRVSGIEVLQTLRERDAPVGPVVVLTTSDADEDITAAYENGAHAYVVKPIDFTSFGKLVRDLARFWLGWNRTAGRS
jgi:two-component system, response regulator